MCSAMESFFGKLPRGSLLLSVSSFLISLDLQGLQVSIEVLNNDLRPPIPKKTPESFAKLMKRCWDRDPNKRPSFKEIIKDLQNMKF